MGIKFTGGVKPLKRTGVAFRAPIAILVNFSVDAGLLKTVDLGVSGSTIVTAAGTDGSAATYTVSSGVLPPGFSLNALTGEISGTSTVAGTYNFSITAKAHSGSGTRGFSIVINPVTIAWNTPAALGTETGGNPFSTTFSASASNGGAVTYSLLSGVLPSGLSFANGAINGTLDNVSAISTFTVRATYADAVTADRTFTLAVSAGTVTWNTVSDLGVIQAGHPLNPFSATASSGHALTYSLISGALPSGFNLGSTGSVTGKAANLTGTSNFTIRAFENALVYADRTFSVTIDQDVLTWVTPATAFASLAGGDVVAFGLQATSDNGEAVSFALQGGALPAGLILANGSVTGSVQNLASSFSFTIRASDINGFIDRTFTGSVVADVITWATAADLGGVNLNNAYGTTLQATSSAGKTVSFALQSGALPEGLTLASTGTLSGTATGIPGTVMFTVRASDGITFNDRTFSLFVNGGPTWVTNSGTVANTALDQSFSSTLVATANASAINYSLLPAQQAQTQSRFVVRAAAAPVSPLPDSVTFAQAANVALVSGYFTSLDPNSPVWASTVSSLGTFNRNVAVSTTLSAAPAAGRSIVAYTVVGAAQNMLPAGLYMATNATAQAATITGNVDLYPLQFSEPEVPFSPSPNWITNAGTLPDAILRTAYSVNLTATPLLGNTISRFTLVSGFLPFGVQMTTGTGNTATLSGTLDPTAAMTDANTVSLPAPVWNTNSGVLATAFNGISGNAVNVSISASPTYGNAITLYAVSGQSTGLPEGVTLNSATGQISGNVSPVAASLDGQYRLPGPTWNTANGSLGSANNGSAVTLNLSVTPRANTTAAVSVISGGVPAGTYLTTTNAVTGAVTISGTLDANTTNTSTTLNVARVFAFTLRATGSDGGYSDQDFTFTANVT